MTEAFDPEHPWRTSGSTGAPLSGTAPKKYTEKEIEENVARKPAGPKSASEASGEPDPKDFVGNPMGLAVARRKWAQKQTSPEAMNKGVSAKRVSGK